MFSNHTNISINLWTSFICHYQSPVDPANNCTTQPLHSDNTSCPTYYLYCVTLSLNEAVSLTVSQNSFAVYCHFYSSYAITITCDETMLARAGDTSDICPVFCVLWNWRHSLYMHIGHSDQFCYPNGSIVWQPRNYLLQYTYVMQDDIISSGCILSAIILFLFHLWGSRW